jgi:spectinomycin phosphotransferase
VRSGWEIDVDDVEYVPLGFGSYHWRVRSGPQEWFVSADDLIAKRRRTSESYREPLDRLQAALATARNLRDDGLEFVVAPIAMPAGELVWNDRDRFAVAIYPYVMGDSADWGSPRTGDERVAVLDLIVRVHRASAEIVRHAMTDDFAIQNLDELTTALEDVSNDWTTGPYAESTRALLDRHGTELGRAMAQYEKLVVSAQQRPERAVLTHGEPHSGNVIITDVGPVLIDWDTALVAPPERDVWVLSDGAGDIRDLYTARTGVVLQDDTLALYRLAWDLNEIAIFVSDFRRPHETTDDTRIAWAALSRCLDPTRWSIA